MKTQNTKKSRKLLSHFQRFFEMEAASGILLAASALVALALANIPLFSETYFHILHLKVFNFSIEHWVNDGLMVIFFFLIGMEIKKELKVGELNSTQKAALPVFAALGGMVAPALVYYIFNPPGSVGAMGWGIPMATDIAFALGVLSLFGKRVPLNLKVFLLALAIVDDLGAVVLIAFFYTKEILGYGFGIAAIGFGLMLIARTIGVRSYTVYVICGAIVWFGVLKSGVHATVAGVIIGLLTPLQFPIAKKSKETYSPLEHLIHVLHPYVGFIIMPIFALANTGIVLSDIDLSALSSNTINLGVALGFILGKPLGILGFSLVAVLFGLASLPKGLGWMHISGVACLGGIGLTMAIFIANLALVHPHIIFAKTGILIGSVISGAIGALMIHLATRKKALS